MAISAVIPKINEATNLFGLINSLILLNMYITELSFQGSLHKSTGSITYEGLLTISTVEKDLP